MRFKRQGGAVKNKYKTPWHVRQYVKRELMDYQNNKKLLEEYEGSTRGLLIAERRVRQIEEAFKELDSEEMKIVRAIFFEKLTQTQAEMKYYISKAQYYYAMDKAIYLCAYALDMIE
jgi:DNA-directed RNA polymerase specialized sigma subunit